MRPLRTLSARPELLVDNFGVRVADPTNRSVVGWPNTWGGERVVYALPTNISGGISLRYQPPWPEGETAYIGMDFTNVIPPGVGIVAGELFFQTNSAVPELRQGDWSGPPVDPASGNFDLVEYIRGRAVYVYMEGGILGTDYQVIWNVTDSDGNGYGRTTLLLCAQTS